MFSEELNQAMGEQDLSVSELSKITGIPKSSISQYRSGKNVPSPKRMWMLENTLGVVFEDQKAESKEQIRRISVDDVARVFQVGHDTIRKGLQQHVFPWGYAVQTSQNHWVYIINGDKFQEVEGVKL